MEFSGRNLRGDTFFDEIGGTDLVGANFSDANLSGSYMVKLDLSKANFTNADLTDAALDYSNLSGAYFIGTNLTGASLCYTNLTGALFRFCIFDEANFRGATFPNGRRPRSAIEKWSDHYTEHGRVDSRFDFEDDSFEGLFEI